MEAEPVAFLGRELEGHLDLARAELAAFLGADPDDLAFVPNATAGVNTVLRSLRFEPGDEILVTDHEYNAALNAARYVAERDGARVVAARVPFPIQDPAQVTEAVLGCVTPRTRLALISHVTSPTALIFPIAEVVRELARRGVDTLVDGAHAPGHGAARPRRARCRLLHRQLSQVAVRTQGLGVPARPARPPGRHPAARHLPRRQRATHRPLALPARVRLDWHGRPDAVPRLARGDPIPWLTRCPAAGPGSWGRTRTLARAGRDLLCGALGVAAPAPDEMLGSMAAVPLPPEEASALPPGAASLGEVLFDVHHIEVPITVVARGCDRGRVRM